MRKKVVVIGSGTGSFTVLQGLKRYSNLDLSVIVTMTDSGGSNRVIRDEFGLLPTSDIRTCIVALASKDSNGLLRKLFTYRYHQGTGISGMTFGNLFMAALADIYGSQEKAIEKTCEIFNIKGNIIPITYDNVQLVAHYENGKQVLGEHQIDEMGERLGNYKIVNLEVFPRATVNKRALFAIRDAHLIILGPGDLFTSVLCNLVIDGIADAINKSKAKKVYVVNLMTKFGETNGFSAKGHLDEVEKYIGGNVDVCLVNHSKSFPKKILESYKAERALPVEDDLKNLLNTKIVRKNFIARRVFDKAKGDVLHRSLIRHDSDQIAKAIVDLL